MTPEPAVWDGVLNDGDILHVPKNWPHVAVPCDQPTLHLTLSIFEYNAVNFLNWLVSTRLSDAEFVHLGISRHSCVEHLSDCLSAIQTKMTAAFSEENILDEFFRDQIWMVTDKAQRFTGRAATRPFFGLPWSATPRGVPDTNLSNYLIYMASPFGLGIRMTDENKVEVQFDREVFAFDASMLPIFEILENDTPFSIADFFQRFNGKLEHEELEGFLGKLINIGILIVRTRIL